MRREEKHRSDPVDIPLGSLGAEEFYDDDDIEELSDEADAHLLAAFDSDAIDEASELKWLRERERNGRGGDKDPYVAGGQRLQKVLAHAGVASRRAAEDLISAGRVCVDGVCVREPGVRVDPLTQVITVDGSRILTDPDVVTVILNKPAGVVTTMEDPAGRPTVAEYGRRFIEEHAGDFEHPEAIRLVHVGRLDTATQGLLLLSNDGELAHRLMHPSFEISKTYIAIVSGQISSAAVGALKNGIELDDGVARADRVVVKQKSPAGSIVEITLHSGKNRIVRRMMEAVGHPVERLARTRLGELGLEGLAPGRMRQLSGAEVQALQQEVGL